MLRLRNHLSPGTELNAEPLDAGVRGVSVLIDEIGLIMNQGIEAIQTIQAQAYMSIPVAGLNRKLNHALPPQSLSIGGIGAKAMVMITTAKYEEQYENLS